jgi:hypothetical protein
MSLNRRNTRVRHESQRESQSQTTTLRSPTPQAPRTDR